MTKILEITTEHVIPFKTLIEGLKDILNDINLEIIRPDDKTNTSTDSVVSESVKKKNVKKNNKKKNKNNSDSDNETDSDSDSENEDDKKNMSDDQVSDTESNNDSKKKSGNKKQDDNSGGIKIAATDSTKTLLINVKLDAKSFSKFECKKKIIDLGINLGQFHKLIKSLDKDDTLSMYINDDDKQNLILKVHNPEKNYETTYKLKLMEINKTQINIPPTVFDSIITFDTSEFHRICREMSNIAEHIEIKCTKKNITYSCKGDCSERSTTFYTHDNGVKIKFGEKAPEINAVSVY